MLLFRPASLVGAPGLILQNAKVLQGITMFLEKIVEAKKEEIRRKKTPFRQRALEEMIPSLPLPRNVMDSVSQHLPIAVIAEIKRASPSLGMINENVDILRFAREYEEGGASVI